MRTLLGLLVLVFAKYSLADHLHWAFLHYHKTGHDLCGYFSNVFNDSASQCKKVVIIEMFRSDKVHAKTLLSADLATIHPNIFLWDSVFNVPQHSFRIVHFVREPFDMVMSAYLYHRQVPYPAPEHFLGSKHYDPCLSEDRELNKFLIPALADFTSGRNNITEMLDNVRALCYSLVKKYPAKDFNTVLNIAVQGKDQLDGVRIEACRALLSVNNGDILRMAYNTLQEVTYLKSHSNVAVRRTFTSEFPVTNLTVYHGSVRSVYDFLMSPVNVKSNLFYNCISEEEAVRFTMTNALATLPKTYSQDLKGVLPSNATSPAVGISPEKDVRAHITSDKLSTADRLAYIQRLEQDPVLGPLLLIVRQIVLNHV